MSVCGPFCLSCQAASVTLKWDINSEPDLAGYKLYYKTDSKSVMFNGKGAAQGDSPIVIKGNIGVITVSGLDANCSYYFAVTAYNTAGIESSYSNIVSVSELVPPLISNFAMPPTIDSHTIPVTALTATDNDAVAGWMLTESGQGPSTDDPGWLSAKPVKYVIGSNGVKTIYAYVKDASGNVSAPRSANVSVTLPTLSVTLSGTDGVVGGTVTSNPGGISCMSGTCSELFDDLSSVKLLLRPNIHSTFVNWSGGCSSISTGLSGSDCTVSMNGSKKITATLKEADRVRIGNKPYTTISSAINAASSGVEVRARAIEFNEQVQIRKSLIFKGGYYSDYGSNSSGFTAIKGSLQIATGSLVVDRLIVK